MFEKLIITMSERKSNKMFKKMNGRKRPGKGRKMKGYGRKSDLTGGGKSASSDMSRITESWMPLFPPSITKTLRYSTNISLGAAVGAPSTWVFRANDLFDPDFTSSGHQPMGFDQLMIWYNHFCVVKSRILCTFRNLGTVSTTCAIRADGDSTSLTVIDRIIEVGGLTMDILEPKGVYGCNVVLEQRIDVAKLQGVARSAMTADPSLQGSSVASPVEVSYFHVAVWDTSGSATTSVQCDVVLEQTAVFVEPRNITESLSSRLASVELKCPEKLRKPLSVR